MAKLKLIKTEGNGSFYSFSLRQADPRLLWNIHKKNEEDLGIFLNGMQNVVLEPSCLSKFYIDNDGDE